ncbi:MAG: class IV aminotransferase [Brevundimonas sp.]|nr:MAG: class IV aminotransferase [Brevundimonas sp.]
MLWIDGEPASPRDLAHQALVNYGAYTSFRVEAGGVRGLDLHLARLERAAVELFGEAVGEVELRAAMRQALDARQEAWLRVSLFAPEISHREVEWRGRPRVMVGVFDPPAPLASGVRVQPQTHQRQSPHLKHVATFDLVQARRAARAEGFDDALFVDGEGRISEGTLWNIGFVAGDRVTWPEAPMLEGVTQALLDQNLAGVGLTSVIEPVRLTDLARFEAAFLCNSATPASAVTAIGDHGFADRPGRIESLRAAWATAPLQPI